MVVLTWQTPPPTPTAVRSPQMISESSKPLAALTSSTKRLKLKTSPGGMTTPSNFSAATSMLRTRAALLPAK